MNLLDAYVTEIKSLPYQKYDKWWVDVIASCWGSPTNSSLMFDTEEEEAENIRIGYHYLT